MLTFKGSNNQVFYNAIYAINGCYNLRQLKAIENKVRGYVSITDTERNQVAQAIYLKTAGILSRPLINFEVHAQDKKDAEKSIKQRHKPKRHQLVLFDSDLAYIKPDNSIVWLSTWEL
jgi:restriction endonuclease Mrr